jgi:hypothetical protein
MVGVLQLPILSVLLALGAESAEPGPAIALPALAYRAPATCPGPDWFADEVRRRIRALGRAIPEADQKRWKVAIWTDDRGAHGRFVSLDAEQHASRREVGGDTCSEVAKALSLIAAMLSELPASAVETSRVEYPAESRAESPAESPAVSSVEAPLWPREERATPRVPDRGPPELKTDSGNAGDDPAPSAMPQAESRSPMRPVFELTPSDSPTWTWAVSGGAMATLSSGITPRALVGVPVFLELSTIVGPDLGPSFRVAFQRASSGALSASSGHAEIVWTVGGVEVCPVRWARGRFELDPCLGAEAGAIEGRRLTAPLAGVTRPYFAGNLSLRLRLRVIDAVSLEAQGGARAAARRERFYFEPDMTIYNTAILGAFGGLGVEVHFP